MKNEFDLGKYSIPTLKKLIMGLKIAFFIIMVSVSNVPAIPSYSRVAKVSPDLMNRSFEQVTANNFLAFASANESQQNRITGTVTEKNGTPLPGVTVVVTGTTVDAITETDGKYSIEVPQGSKKIQDMTYHNDACIHICLTDGLKVGDYL